MEKVKVNYQHLRVLASNKKTKGRPDPIYFINPKNKDYSINSRGGWTICTIEIDNTIMIIGEALCSMSDNFCYKTGRDIAFKRAFKVLMELRDSQIPNWIRDKALSIDWEYRKLV